MKITSERIRGILKKSWSNLEYIWLTDPYYWVIKYSYLEEIVKANSLKDMEYQSDIWDCDNYALQLHARIQLYQYDLLKKGIADIPKISWAFGECIGLSKFMFSTTVHAQNIAVTDKGIVLIEPRTDKIWFVDKNEDNLFFVKF